MLLALQKASRQPSGRLTYQKALDRLLHDLRIARE
jgi:hypothetical protein